jgi:hypothetical protein
MNSENEISNRLKILKNRNLDELQEEFLKTKNERNISVKINKQKVENSNLQSITNIVQNQTFHTQNSLPTSSTIPSNQIKKKKKDVISLDINILNSITKPTFQDNQATSSSNLKGNSIFKSAIDLNSSLVKSTDVNKETGLPDTFTVDKSLYNQDLSKNVLRGFRPNHQENYNLKIKNFDKDERINLFSTTPTPNSEYAEIHQKNLDLLKSMSKDELLEYTQTIKAKIPEKLLEKMKSGYFSKKLNENSINSLKNEKIENQFLKSNKSIEEKEDYDSQSEDEEKLSSSIKNNQKSDNLVQAENNENSNIFEILIKYNGEFKIQKLQQNQETNASHSNNVIDYSKLKLKELDLDNKFFSLTEVKNLLMSSSEQQVTLGLQLSTYLLDKNLILNIFKFSLKINELKLWSIFYYLIDHKSLKIRILSLNNLVKLFDILFSFDVEIFTQNFLVFNNFPVFKVKYFTDFKFDQEEVKKIYTEKNLEYISPNLNHKFILKMKKEVIDFFSSEEVTIKSIMNIKNFIKMILITNEGKNSSTNSILNEKNYLKNYFSLLFYNMYLSDLFMNSFRHSELEAKFKEMLSSKILNDLLNDENNKNNSSDKDGNTFKNIFEKLLISILSNLATTELDEYLMIIKNKLISPNENCINQDNLNFISLLRVGRLINDYEFSNKSLQKMNLVEVNTLTKVISGKNIDDRNVSNLMSEDSISIKNLFSNFDTFFKQENNKNDNLLSYNEISKISKLLGLKIKYFRYANNDELDYTIVDSRNEILILENSITELINHLEKLILTQPSHNVYDNFNSNYLLTNSIFDLLNSLIILTYTSIKYPKSIKYMQSIEIKSLLKLIPILEKISCFYLRNLKGISENETKDENYIEILKFEFLYKIENFVKLNLNFIKLIQKYYRGQENKINHVNAYSLINLILTLPSFFNTNSEGYYFKFLKNLNSHFTKKIANSEYLNTFIKKINFNYDLLVEDLNLYLNSNEDLRKSQILKNVMKIEENLNFILFNDYAWVKSNNNPSSLGKYTPILIKSKFLPFGNNFILQILYNDKISSEVKLNYLTFLTIISYEEKINPENLNPFEIILKTLIKFKDVINENKAEFIFSEFVKILIFNENNLNLTQNKNKLILLEKNRDNEMFVQMFFNKFEFENPNEKEISFYYKFLLLFLVLYHSGCDLGYESLNLLFYTNFIKIIEKFNFENLVFLQQGDTKSTKPSEPNFILFGKIIDYIMNNLTIKNLDLYQTLIMTFLKFSKSRGMQIWEGVCKDNFLIDLICRLNKIFGIVENLDDVEEINMVYIKFITDDGKEIKQKILEKLVNN